MSPKEKLRDLRDKAGLSVRESADLAGMSAQTLRKLESGDTPVTRSYAVRMADAYRTTVDDILDTGSPDALPPPIVPAPMAKPPDAPAENLDDMTAEERAEAVDKIKKLLGSAEVSVAPGEEFDEDSPSVIPPLLPIIGAKDPPVDDDMEEDEEPPPPPMLVTQNVPPPEDDDMEEDEPSDPDEFSPFEQPSDVSLNPKSGFEKSGNHLLEKFIDALAPVEGVPVVCLGVMDSTGTTWEGVSVGPQDGALVKVPESVAGMDILPVPELEVRHDMTVSRRAFKAGESWHVRVFVDGYPMTIKKGMRFAVAIPGSGK